MRALYLSGRHSEAVQRYADYRAHLADALGLEPTASLQRSPSTSCATRCGRPRRRTAERSRVRQPVGSRGCRCGTPAATTATGSPGRRPETGNPLLALPAWVHRPRGHRQRQGPALVAAGAAVAAAASSSSTTGWARVCHEGRSSTTASSPASQSWAPRRRAGRTARGAARRLAVGADRGRLRGPPPGAGPGARPARHLRRRPDDVPQRRTAADHRRDAPGALGTRLHACSPAATGPAPPTRPPTTWPRVLRDSADSRRRRGLPRGLLSRSTSRRCCPTSAPRPSSCTTATSALAQSAGGRQLAAGIPGARLLALDGGYHLPDAADLDQIVVGRRRVPRARGTRDSSVPAG